MYWLVTDNGTLFAGKSQGLTRFDPLERTIKGPASEEARIMRDQLRRHGIRFRYEEKGGQYVPWEP